MDTIWKCVPIAAGCALSLAACGQSSEKAAAAAEIADTAAPAGAAGDASADGTAARPGGENPAAPAASEAGGAEAAAASAAKPAAGTASLEAYVGKFPFDEVGGVTWHDHPLVQAGIRKTVSDAAVRKAMQSPGGPSAPIATYQGKVGSWGCQAHNCGDHQWAVLVDPKSGATDVCYHDAEKTGEASRWFLANGSEEMRPGNCSVV